MTRAHGNLCRGGLGVDWRSGKIAMSSSTMQMISLPASMLTLTVLLLCHSTMPQASFASNQYKPVLKMIDPLTAKYASSKTTKKKGVSSNQNTFNKTNPASTTSTGSDYLTQQQPAYQGISDQSYTQTQTPPQVQNNNSSFPTENMLPEFGQPLPGVNPAPSNPQEDNQSKKWWSTPVSAQDLPLNKQNTLASEEQRVQRLELTAFGTTYSKHEVEDRVDHLEKEVLGRTTQGLLSERLSRLETKLSNVAFTAPDATKMTNSPIIPSSSIIKPSPVDTNAGQSNFAQDTSTSIPYANQAVGMSNWIKPPNSYQPSSPVVTQTPKVNSTFSIPYYGNAGDYFGYVCHFPGNTVARFSNFPIKVHLPNASSEVWNNHMEEAIRAWSKIIPIEIASANEPANIEVIWVNHLVSNYLGITRLNVFLGQPTVQIFLLQPNFYQPGVSTNTISGVLLHELGHALGILGHSDSNKDLMYSIAPNASERGKAPKYRFPSISHRDINTLKKIYDSPTLPPYFMLPQPMEWGTKAN